MVFKRGNVTLEEIRGGMRAFEGCFRGFCVSDGGIVACVEIGGVGAVFRCVVEGFIPSFFLGVLIFVCY